MRKGRHYLPQELWDYIGKTESKPNRVLDFKAVKLKLKKLFVKKDGKMISLGFSCSYISFKNEDDEEDDVEGQIEEDTGVPLFQPAKRPKVDVRAESSADGEAGVDDAETASDSE